MLWICTDATVNWTAVAAVGQLCLGAGVAFVAYRQWRTAQSQAETARKKLRAELFDRKYAKYEELVSLATTVMHGRAPDSCTVDIQRVRKEMSWLFGEEASNWVKQEVEKIARDIWLQEQLFNNTHAPPAERKQILIKKHDLILLLSNNLDKLASVITPQMTLGD